MNFIITSEQRVGSRWMHYLLAELFGLTTSPEIDVGILRDNEDVKNSVRFYFKTGRVVKFHRALYEDITDHLQPVNYKVLAVVRNPRDRGVSLTFHNRYHKKHHFRQKDFHTDREAMEFTILEDNGFHEGNDRQLKLMKPGWSTFDYSNGDGNYLWTTYEWLKEDTQMEVEMICEYLGLRPKKEIKEIVHRHSFQTKSGRKPGQENRKNLWRRKGITNDWMNWFTPEMKRVTQDDWDLYWEVVEGEG